VVSPGGWILAATACAPEHAVAARALLFGSSKLKEALWAALEKVVAEVGALHKCNFAAAKVRYAAAAAAPRCLACLSCSCCRGVVSGLDDDESCTSPCTLP
jgi:hypothetical protein